MKSTQIKSRAPPAIGSHPWRRAGVGIAATAVIAMAATASAQAANPTWQADVYYTVGSVVSYNGHSYTALVSQVDYRGTGWSPTVSTLWKDLGAESGDGKSNLLAGVFARTSNTASSCALAWNADNVYTSGGVASLNGVNYKANWWTQGEDPASHSAGSGGQPWSIVGNCSNRSKTAVDTNGARHSNAPDGSESTGTRAAQADSKDHEG
jgi:chitodextrinase